jgi:hypothetical protein
MIIKRDDCAGQGRWCSPSFSSSHDSTVPVVCMCVCVCIWVSEWVSEWACVWVSECECVCEWVSVCVCEWVSAWVWASECERVNVCVCVCVWVSECVCVCVCVCREVALSSWKTALLFGHNICIIGCAWSLKLSTYHLAAVRPWRVITGPAECHYIGVQTITGAPPCRVHCCDLPFPLGVLQM